LGYTTVSIPDWLNYYVTDLGPVGNCPACDGTGYSACSFTLSVKEGKFYYSTSLPACRFCNGSGSIAWSSYTVRLLRFAWEDFYDAVDYGLREAAYYIIDCITGIKRRLQIIS
jgi:hypothetical protein